MAGDGRRRGCWPTAALRAAASFRWPAGSSATGPYRCADGYVTLGALEPKFWAAFCQGVGREDLLGNAFDPPGSDAHRAVCEMFAARTREEWEQFASEHDCCLEPVMDLDEALDGELVAAREMVVELDQPGAERPVKLLGLPVKLSRTPGDPVRAPGPGLGEHTRRGAGAGRIHARGDRRAARGRRGGRAGGGRRVQGSFMAG